MKKFFRWAGISAALFASFLSLGMHFAYAEELPQTPTVTLNCEPAPIRAEMIDGKLYFSLRDYWVNIAMKDPATIKWYGDAQTVTDGFDYIQLADQTLIAPIVNIHQPLADPAILKDGITYVTASYLEASIGSRYVKYEADETSLYFRNLIWEQEGYDFKYQLRVAPFPINEETGLPDFESMFKSNHYNYFDYSDDLFDISRTETNDNKIIFTYVSKQYPERFFIATVQDGYVSHVADHDALTIYRLREID